MSERTVTCKRCGDEAEHPVRLGSREEGDYYCNRYCMLEDNPDLVKGNKNAQERLKIGRKRAAVKTKMRALKKEALEVGIPWN